MGLCKCPKKKVTNLFCFEHRVNVCEHCLVANHPRCVVQSYLQWLQDSDYDPACRLCGKNLNDEQCGECVRLTCYDVFHWSCVDSYARQLPANTAPAGYTCPACNSCVFPAPNVASPVAETLRRTLIQVNWARAGLGLPLIEERGSTGGSGEPAGAPSISQGRQVAAVMPQQSASIHASYSHGATKAAVAMPINSGGQQLVATSPPHSVISVDDSTPYTRAAPSDFNPRKLFDTTQEDSPLLNKSHDHDLDKYKRRPALQWFFRWFNSRPGKKRQDPNARTKRIVIILVLLVIGFVTLIMILTRVGRASADQDPFLDPLANPNIRVEAN